MNDTARALALAKAQTEIAQLKVRLSQIRDCLIEFCDLAGLPDNNPDDNLVAEAISLADQILGSRR